MTIRHLSHAIATGLLACGLTMITPAPGLAQQAAIAPDAAGPITMYGCFARTKVGHEGHKFVLANPTLGPATSVTESTCSVSGNEPMVELDDIHANVHKHHLDASKVGHWVEITGRLNKAKHQTLREVDVRSYRLIPVEAPRVALAEPTPAPPTQYQPFTPAPAPVPRAAAPRAEEIKAPAQLPQTASPLPLVALIGIVSLAGGLALRLEY